MKVSNRP